jgi:hypothetical protein
MKLNSYQQQLLQTLNIKYLSLNADFQHVAGTTGQQSENLHNKSKQQTAEIAEFALLASDIRLLLSQLTPELNWQIEPKASSCYYDADVLITPELSVLQQATFKRQLWQLLNPRLNDV